MLGDVDSDDLLSPFTEFWHNLTRVLISRSWEINLSIISHFKFSILISPSLCLEPITLHCWSLFASSLIKIKNVSSSFEKNLCIFKQKRNALKINLFSIVIVFSFSVFNLLVNCFYSLHFLELFLAIFQNIFYKSFFWFFLSFFVFFFFFSFAKLSLQKESPLLQIPSLSDHGYTSI